MSKSKLIFLYTSLSTGGGLTFLRKFSSLHAKFDIFTICLFKTKNVPDDIQQGKIIDIFGRRTVIVSNTQLTSLILILFLPWKRFVYVTHGYANAHSWVPRLRKIINLFIYWCPWSRAEIVGCGYDEYKQVVRLKGNNKSVHRICNGIDDMFDSKRRIIGTKKERGNESKSVKILFAGRKTFQKGPDLLLAALQDVNVLYDVDFVGPIDNKDLNFQRKIGSMEDKLKHTPHKVSFLSERELDRTFLSSYDFVVVPSRFEGLPFFILELLNYKIPFIISDCRGHNEFKAFLPAFMFFNFKDPKSLVKLLSDTELPGKLLSASKSYTLPTEYTLDHFSKNYCRLFEKLYEN
jgi:glycosyltransferase involved in cell wall biosynthesis